MESHITIEVGEFKKIKLKFFKTINILYCGMPQKDTFSIGYMYGSGAQGFGFNVYYPASAPTIQIQSVDCRVISVTPKQLTLSIRDITEEKIHTPRNHYKPMD